MLEAFERRHGMQDYDKYLAKLTRLLNERRISVGRYRKLPWPAGFVPKKRRR